jgi:hypothetical protein
MFRSTKVTAMLADHAAVAEGKLYLSGGGWTITGPDPMPFAIAMLIEMPWDSAGVQHTAKLELIDSEGNPVMGDTPAGTQEPIAIHGGFGMTPGPELRRGTPLQMPLALNVPPLMIPPGGRYEWRVEIDGETHEDWRLGFTTRPGSQSQAA